MTKLEKAARQALGALESYSKSDYIKKQHPKRRANGEKAITALRKALAERSNHESELMMNDGNYRRKILAEPDIEEMTLTQISARHEQAEQEPVAVVEITYGREPECYVTGNIDDFPEGVFKLYAAPVRTKDLTNEDKLALWKKWNMTAAQIDAVIAKFKEKNK